jgi:hypothetical protein
MAAVRKRVPVKRVVCNKPRTQDHGAHSDLVHPCRVVKVDRAGRTKLLAGLASPTFLKINALVRVNHVLQGNGLRVWKIGGFSFAQPQIIGIDDSLRAFFFAGAAGNTQAGINVAGVLCYGRLKVSRLPRYTLYLR